MAQIDARLTDLIITMDPLNGGADLVNTASFVSSDAYHYQWNSTSGSHITALSFDGTIVADALFNASAGNIHALTFGRGTTDDLSITDVNASLLSILANPVVQHQEFWRAVLAGETTIYAPEIAPSVFGTDHRAQSFSGDFINLWWDEPITYTGGNDVFNGGAFFLNYGTSYRRQDFVGDAYLVSGDASLVGGHDTINSGMNGFYFGDAREMLTTGTLTGGADTFNLSGANVQGSTVALGFEANLYGDVKDVGQGRLVGGGDTFNITNITGVTRVIGDAQFIGSLSANSTGGNDTITMTAAVAAGVHEVYGDVWQVSSTFTAGNDQITMVNFGGAAGSRVSGDGELAYAGFTGGADTISVTNGTFGTISGDLVHQQLGNFTGGADTMTLTNTTADLITGDLFDVFGAGANVTGGGDTITTRNAQFIYGDFRANSDGGTIVGGADRITVNYGGGLMDTIYGDGFLLSAGGNVTFGNDIVIFNGSVGVTIVGDIDEVTAPTVVYGSDTLTGGSGNDFIYGDFENLSDTSLASAGHDVIDGRGGNDILDGGVGNDVLIGGLGNDSLFGGEGSDTAKYDTVLQSVYVDLNGIPGTTNRHAMGQGFDTLNLIENVTGSGLNDVIRGSGDANVLRGGNGNDQIEGREGIDTLHGDAGNDVLNGGDGIDTLVGGTGNDIYQVDSASDVLTELLNEGTDTVQAGFTYSLATKANIENLSLTGGAAINGTGNTLNNQIIGNSGANTLDGGTGNDVLIGLGGLDTFIGGLGNDVFYVDSQSEVVTEALNAGTDTVVAGFTYSLAAKANVENLILTGGVANATGNTLNNALTGNGAANVLNGLQGNDTMTGGAGLDTFAFNTALNAATNLDRINDFNIVDDVIHLENTGAGLFTAITGGLIGGGGVLAAAAFVKNATGVATTVNNRIVYNTTTGDLFYDADGSGAGASIKFATIVNKAALTNADFIVI